MGGLAGKLLARRRDTESSSTLYGLEYRRIRVPAYRVRTAIQKSDENAHWLTSADLLGRKSLTDV